MRMIDQLSNPELLRSTSFINGEWIEGDKKFKVYDPFSNEVVAEVTDHGAAQTKEAINAATKAFGSWSGFTASKRSRILKNWYDLLHKNADDLAVILTTEQGKPVKEAKGEVLYGASYVEWFAEEARRVYGDVIPGHTRSTRITVIKQPIGVVGAITPWNFPSAMVTRKVAPALAAGCTVVIKPSELTPLSALALAQLTQEAGIPPGVFNVICSNQAEVVGMELTGNPLVRKISFTGSTEVGKLLLKQSAGTVKKVSLELGGNAPFIVFDDADVEAAVAGAIASKYRNAGQTCICSNRIFVHSGVYDQFMNGLIDATSKLSIGSGFADGVTVGPMIEEKAIESVERLLKDANSKGGEVMFGGKRSTDNRNVFEPTIIKDAHPEMKLFQQEIFGPLAPVFRFETEEEVVQLANSTNYGLAAYFYGRDHARIWRVAEALEFGMVGINTGLISTPVAPFGGVKESGFGREGSKYGMDDYLNVKYLCWGGVE